MLPGRRKVGHALLVLGAFSIVFGPLLSFYVYPHVANAPRDEKTTTVVQGTAETLLNPSTFKVMHNVTMTSTNTITGDMAAAKQYGHNILVYESDTKMAVNGQPDTTGLLGTQERVAEDRHTAQAVNCCKAKIVNEATTIGGKHYTQSGVDLKLPFNTQKKSYPWWDMWTGSTAFPMSYVETTTLARGLAEQNVPDRQQVKHGGMTVYKFVQVIQDQPIFTAPIPAQLVGDPNTAESSCVDHYTNIRTELIEPNTGAPVYQEENQHQQCVYPSGFRADLAKVDMKMTIASVDDKANLASAGVYLGYLRTDLPIFLPVFGLLLVVIGGWLVRSTARPAAVPQAAVAPIAKHAAP